MPYKRQYRSRRRTRRRPTKKSTPIGWNWSTAGKALKIATRVASMVNAERNHFDTTTSPAPTTTGVLFPLELIPEGDDTQNRTGRSIKLAGLDIKWLFNSAAAATGTSNIRVMFIIDWWQAGTAPTITDILVSSNTTSFRQIDSVSPQRFKVIYDKVISLSPQTADNPSQQINRFFPLKHHLRYIGTTAAVGSAGAGQVYACLFADQVATNAVTSILNVRSFYYDN